MRRGVGGVQPQMVHSGSFFGIFLGFEPKNVTGDMLF